MHKSGQCRRVLMVWAASLGVGMAWAEEPAPQPSRRADQKVTMVFEQLKLSYQPKQREDEVWEVASGRHTTRRKRAMRLVAVDFKVVHANAQETLIEAQPRYRVIFGKESSDYWQQGVPFAVKKRLPVAVNSQRIVLHWQDEIREVSTQRASSAVAKAAIKTQMGTF